MINTNMLTLWGEKITDKPLQEYPRPQLARDSYINLNGLWDYAITQSKDFPKEYEGKILVPFSPESPLSKVVRSVTPRDFLHYRTVFSLSKNFNKGRVLLNFGAVDCICAIYLNGSLVGQHKGGYTAFSVELTKALVLEENLLQVVVSDPSDTSFYSRGKQKQHRGGMWYTPQSGIWQTVWLESVPQNYIERLELLPKYDKNEIEVTVFGVGEVTATITIFDCGKEVAQTTLERGQTKASIGLTDIKSWSPESPFLYDLTVEYGEDKVTSYFGMRKYSVAKDSQGITRIMLNNKPYFMNGVLDQGYYSDGLLTPPSVEAMKFDIEETKSLGYNMLRKHIKIEPMLWYYLCDRLGMIVWQDMVNSGTKYSALLVIMLPFIKIQKIKDKHYRWFGRRTKENKDWFVEEMRETITQLYNCVSISEWTVFNEGWGQFDAKEMAKLARSMDRSRIVDHASGWHDQGGGDLKSLHVYFRPIKPKQYRDNRAIVVSEFGGYSYKEAEHSYNSESTYSYNRLKDKKSFNIAVEKLYRQEIIPYIPLGLCASVYTQVSDVEDEVNGLYTYDRKICKVDKETMRKFNAEVKL